MESPHPLGPDAPTVDYVGLAFRALACAMLVGLALNLATLGAVRTVQVQQPPATVIDLSSTPAVMLLGGIFLSCLIAALVCWTLLAPIKNAYRQGMLAMVTFFGSFVISTIGKPIDQIVGRNGLFGGAVVALLAAGWTYRAIRHLPVFR